MANWRIHVKNRSDQDNAGKIEILFDVERQRPDLTWRAVFEDLTVYCRPTNEFERMATMACELREERRQAELNEVIEYYDLDCTGLL